jgi:hypothetical protein
MTGHGSPGPQAPGWGRRDGEEGIETEYTQSWQLGVGLRR